MGLDYSFHFWVPREKLFEALSVVAQRAESGHELERLVWPDGRRLPAIVGKHRTEPRDLVPLDGSLEYERFCLSFLFEPDDALKEFDTDSEYRCLRADGRYSVGCIYLHLDLETDWLEGEPLFVGVAFVAATTGMSILFAQSTSVQRFFVSLADSLGAVSCSFDHEDTQQRLLLLDGREVDFRFDRDLAPPRFLRHLLGEPLSELARALRLCLKWGEVSSAHELLEVQLLTRHEDAGVRCESLAALWCGQEKESLAFLLRATSDAHPRVRSTVARYLGESDGETPRELLTLLDDDVTQVRIAAALALRGKKKEPEVFERLHSLLFLPSSPLHDLGLVKAAFNSLFSYQYPSNHYSVEVLEAVASHSDFLFPNMAREPLESYRRHIERERA